MHWYLARSLYPMHLLKNESAFAEIFRRRFRFRRRRHALAPVFCCDPEVFLRVYVQVEPVVQAERVLSESVGKRRKPFAFQYGALAPPSLAVREPSRVLVGFLASPPFHIFPFLTTRETKVNQHPPPPAASRALRTSLPWNKTALSANAFRSWPSGRWLMRRTFLS